MIEKIKMLKNETWKVIKSHTSSYGDKYSISNQGRLIKYRKNIEDGSILKLGEQAGYRIWRFKKGDIFKSELVHRLVASYFLPKPKKGQDFVMHLNFKKSDNKISNLIWATRVEITQHNKKNPLVKERLEKLKNGTSGIKYSLTEKNVIQIKKLLAQGKTLHFIALKYGVSDMQIHRIKKGVNWGWVKI